MSKEKVFIVIALTCSGFGKKIYRAGDEVSENCFPPGQFNTLIEKGFIGEKPEEKPEEEKVTEPPMTEPPAVTDEGSDKTTVTGKPKK